MLSHKKNRASPRKVSPMVFVVSQHGALQEKAFFALIM